MDVYGPGGALRRRLVDVPVPGQALDLRVGSEAGHATRRFSGGGGMAPAPLAVGA